ncbi:MAG: AAA family ATPase [Bacteroidales bacterium]|nr:MAG: AAA family ATPase [Bacteroidales bacterium]
MRFLSFRIQNFRSIVDTGWIKLSPDNITGLIGQNESGKTSILEALNSFYEGSISEDILRSDLSMPRVSCIFGISGREFTEILNEKLLPAGILRCIKDQSNITLDRIWDEDFSSRIEIGGDDIIQCFDEHYRKVEERDERIQSRIDKILVQKKKANDNLQLANQEKEKVSDELELLKENIGDLQRMVRSSPAESKGKMEKKLKSARNNLDKTRERLEAKRRIADEQHKTVREIEDQARYAEQSNEARMNFAKAEQELEEAFHNLAENQRIFELADSEKEKRAARIQLDLCNDRHVKAVREYERCREEAIVRRVLAYKILQGKELSMAEREIKQEKPQVDRYYSRVDAGNELFKFIPEFVLFEDFSSLLPNRIDLDDILSQNRNVEGYKAANNFLKISGLDSDFFKQISSRILKQKIEKLNNEITINFQDYWRQKIGQQNKISLNFELEHYDHSQPDKSGYPYIEFWIRDQQERLYPKQRSRGVRWFLSFYLELKAAAMEKKSRNKVLLIDEPGLSLHARAQEDVLKVFENIKEKIQIIYTTHSPHLIDLDKLYRLLAVQRAAEDYERSETMVFDAKSLTSASTDTLSPIYTLMGSRLTEQQFIQQKNNVILEDITAYYYLSAFLRMIKLSKEMYLLPATDVSNVGNLVNLLLGWGLEFIVVTDDDSEGKKLSKELKLNLFGNDDQKADEKLISIGNDNCLEDLFSTIDFKKFILHQRIGIPESNSEFIKINGYSRSILAANFMQTCRDAKLKFSDFDDETQDNFESLFREIQKRLD